MKKFAQLYKNWYTKKIHVTKISLHHKLDTRQYTD